jgi:hypothetical protein
MRAWLELVECSGAATCSLAAGERFALPPDRVVGLGRRADCDIVISSPAQGGRLNCTIRSRGTHHEFMHAGHSQPIFINGVEAGHSYARDLVDGDEIMPGIGLRLRYVVDNGEGGVDDGFDTDLATAGPFVVFDQCSDVWRCVPIDDPSAPPRRLLGITGPDPLRRWRRALAAGGGTTAVRASWDDGDRRLVVVDDIAGASLEELLVAGKTYGGHLDATFVAALLRPSLHTIVSTRVDVFVDARAWCVTFDGAVVFDGFVHAALSGLPHFVRGQSAGQELIEVVAHIRRRSAAIPDGDFALPSRRDPGGDAPREASALTALQRLRAWIDAQPAVSSSTWQGLVAGLFPARVARERALRERLALLDADTIARLPRR